MKLITELNEDVEYFAEAKENGEKNHYIQGVFLQSNIKNRNGRMYPESVMDREVGRYIRESVEKGRGWGELNHPQGPTINLDRVSHRIVELRKEGTNWIGKAVIAPTPHGNIVRGLMECSGQLGVSSRALGSLVEKNGIMEVQGDLKLATAADIVADPSAPDAFVQGIMEGVEWVYNPVKGTWHEERLENIRKEVHQMSKRELEEKRLAIFEDYILSLTSANYK